MPQTSVVFSSILGPSGSGQVQPGMGERGSGAGGAGDLIFQDGRLVSGSLEALMEHLVPTVDYYPDVSAWAWGGTQGDVGEGDSGGDRGLGGGGGGGGTCWKLPALGEGETQRRALPEAWKPGSCMSPQVQKEGSVAQVWTHGPLPTLGTETGLFICLLGSRRRPGLPVPPPRG